MSKGAYVHWAWWNNLCKPYLGGPLHYDQSHPGTAADLASFATPQAAANKAVPADDYQFLADAKLLLSAIRGNNPEAIIIVVGHSMGGNSCARLARQSTVVIDIAAPIDPVGNRNYPWAGPSFQNNNFYNWTRWRATRGMFDGFKGQHFLPLQGGCTPVEPWFETFSLAQLNTDLVCTVHVDNATAMAFQSNVINLWHRWQTEAAFPFDFEASYNLGTDPPLGGTDTQGVISMQSSGDEDGGWPGPNSGGDCCPNGEGVAWPGDGHGEIIGTRGPALATRPLGTRVRTSPECDGCPNQVWPARGLESGNWIDTPANVAERIYKMQELESLPFCDDPPNCTNDPPPSPSQDTWAHRPYNAALCKVSKGLINRFNTMNKSPVPDAGPDQVIHCAGCTSALVTLDASGTTDESSELVYTWTWNGGSAAGAIANVVLPYGSTCVELEVKDPTGHISLDYAVIKVADPEADVLPYSAAATIWKKDVGAHEAYAFDSFYPGTANGTGCLLPEPTKPAVIELKGGTLTVSADAGGDTYCAITDASTAPAVSDAFIIHNNAAVNFEFDPPVTSFYTYFGSLAVGHTATMKLYGEGGPMLIDTITTLPSTDISQSSGLGFISTTPIDRIEFTATEDGPVLVGAFGSLKPGEPSLGRVEIDGYQGPDGELVELDFGVGFVDLCPADIVDSNSVDVDDLLAVINAWGPCPAPPNECPANIATAGKGPEAVDVNDLLAVINAWGACP
jgi:hypothetical protein